MSALPEPSAERDAAIEAMLPLIETGGWNQGTLRRALAASGGAEDDAEFLFPGGAIDMVEAFSDWADRRMAAEASPSLMAMRLPERVRSLITLRLAQARPHRVAVRRALAVLALPRHARTAARCTARTVDAIWHAAGDSSADFSWYTKRAILAAVYGGTLLFWLRDYSDAESETLAFLDRRLADVRRLGKLRPRFS